MKNMKLTDESHMPFGKYKGDRMVDVPAHYLIYIYESGNWNLSTDVKEYIEDNMDALKQGK